MQAQKRNLTTNSPSETSQDAELLIEGFEKAGISWDRSPRNIKDCALSAACLTGETHDVKGLYIVDASIIPTSFALNPSETIYALSSYISDQINS